MAASRVRDGMRAGRGLIALAGGLLGLAALAGALAWWQAARAVRTPRVATRARAVAQTLRPLGGPLRIVLRSASGRAGIALATTGGGKAVEPHTGRLLATLPAGATLFASADYESERVLLTGPGVKVWQPAIRLVGGGLFRAGGRRYPGSLLLRLYGSGVQLVNEVGLEPYLEGVLPGEIPAAFGFEAQKALAVAARTYALRNREKHAEEGGDLCDGVHCQVYHGSTTASPRGTAAVRATRGLCCWYGDELVCTFYAADCGGQTTSARHVPLTDMPPVPPPYLRPVRDRPGPGMPDYCRASPSHWWSIQLGAAEVEAALNAQPETWIGALRTMQFARRDSTGRVTEVRLWGDDPNSGPFERTITGWELRRRVGPRRIKSTLMRIAAKSATGFRITGSGNGHGLGLCQIGANGMAQAPYRRSFRQILAHYYPGTRVAALGR